MGREGAGVATDKAGSTQGQAMQSLVDLIKDLSILGTMGIKQRNNIVCVCLRECACVCVCIVF